MFGSGAAGVGISNLLMSAMREEGLSEAEARGRIYCFNRYGLVIEGGRGIKPDQLPFARTRAEVADWKLSGGEDISLLDVVRNANITILAGVSAQGGAFTEEIVREMANHTQRPIIFPMSNPTSCSEATPQDLLRWTEGRAVVGTGSPFPPVEVNGKLLRISQVNNSFIFPGLALGILVSKARRVTDNMIMAAAKALAQLSPAREESSKPLLPPVGDARKVGLIVGEAVGRQAMADDVSDLPDAETLKEQLHAYVWEPIYLPYERID